jgi:cell division septum initiation protein DivIVA
MVRQTHNDDSDRVDAAFNRVLAAEAKAREAVEECRQAATAVLAAAEEHARRIASRADRRVRLAHRIADAQVARALSDLLTPTPTEPAAGLDAETLARLDRAIAALADEILRPGNES